MQLMCEIFMEIGLPGGVVNVIHGSRDIPGTWYEDCLLYTSRCV